MGSVLQLQMLPVAGLGGDCTSDVSCDSEMSCRSENSCYSALSRPVTQLADAV